MAIAGHSRLWLTHILMLKIGCTLVYSYLFTFKYGTLNLMPQMIYPEVLFMVDIHCYIQCLAFGESYPFRNERRETVLGKLDSSCIGLAGLATGFQNPNAMPLLEPYEPASGAFKVFDIQFRSLGKLLGLCEDAVVKNVSIFSPELQADQQLLGKLNQRNCYRKVYRKLQFSL